MTTDPVTTTDPTTTTTPTTPGTTAPGPTDQGSPVQGFTGPGGNYNDDCRGDDFSTLDEHWLRSQIQSSRFEIISGLIALRRSGSMAQRRSQRRSDSSSVRRLAERLIRDHRRILEEAEDLADDLDIDVPRGVSPLHAWALRVLATFEDDDDNHSDRRNDGRNNNDARRSQNGRNNDDNGRNNRNRRSEFDRQFIDLQIAALNEAIDEAENEAEDGCNREVRELARDVLRVLRDELRQAEGLARTSRHHHSHH